MEKLTATEAIYGFCAWLTTRKGKTVLGSNSDCAPVGERIKEFCEVNHLGDARDNYTEYLTFPS